MFEKNLAVSDLLCEYAPVLSDRHRELLDFYYNQDLSLAEIAAEVGISRQGVRDGIKKAEEELFFLEDKLHLLQRSFSLRRTAEQLLAKADENTKTAVLTLLRAAGVDEAELSESEGAPDGNV
jgi:predicted DNA-binding protein YlxM (UPF0122 family)